MRLESFSPRRTGTRVRNVYTRTLMYSQPWEAIQEVSCGKAEFTSSNGCEPGGGNRGQLLLGILEDGLSSIGVFFIFCVKLLAE